MDKEINRKRLEKHQNTKRKKKKKKELDFVEELQNLWNEIHREYKETN